jgi:phosphotransferase system enzyme I (PtsI)
MTEAKNTQKKEIVFHGIPASPGIAIGTVLLIASHNSNLKTIQDIDITTENVAVEISKFNRALDKTRQDIQELQKRIQSCLEEREASIFDAHLLIVDDKMLMNEVEDFIRKKLKAAEYAFNTVIQRYISALSVMPDQYIKERADDIKDVASRVIANLRGMSRPLLDHLPGQKIVIANDLTPSDTALLDRDNVQAFAIETGSRTSHTAILARSMKIPAVVGLQNLVEKLHNGDLVIVDGFIGTVIINPKEQTQNLYAVKETRKEKFYADLLKESRLRPETIDGFRIQLAANIERPEDIEDAKRYGAAGVGLFRTEYLFMNSQQLPSEESQFEIYKKAVEDIQGQPIIIRTLDVGGDKLADLLISYHEPNPFLGLRAIRLCLEKQDIFRTQLRAIIRASAFGPIKLMFPMITCLEEIEYVLEILDEIKEELTAQKIDFNKKLEIGIMIEVPSAAIIADVLAEKVDFFSIGTNDLVQYTLAVDRRNERVAYLYQPSHPAILSLIQKVVNAAKKNQIWVSVCGEMAGDPRYTPLLVGLGVHELSMSPVSMGSIRRIIRRMRMYEAEEVAEKAVSCRNAEEALEMSEALLYKIAPDIVSLAIKGL